MRNALIIEWDIVIELRNKLKICQANHTLAGRVNLENHNRCLRGLEVMFANCKMGRIAISCIPDEDEPFFVCLLASNAMECGLLKVKIELITDQLAKILFNEREDEEEEETDDADELQLE